MVQQVAAIALFLAINMIASAQPASGSGGFGTSIVTFSTEACDDTGLREWVELTGTSGLLCGRPKRESIELITVYAPGCDEGHLIFRELKAPDGTTHLLFSAPASLMMKILRATIYLKGYRKNLTLLEHVGGVWKRRRPQKVHVSTNSDGDIPQDTLLAFSVGGLGLFSLQEKDLPVHTASPLVSHQMSASSLLGGGISRGLLPLGFSIILLAGCWVLSRWVHRMEQYADK